MFSTHCVDLILTAQNSQWNQLKALIWNALVGFDLIWFYLRRPGWDQVQVLRRGSECLLDLRRYHTCILTNTILVISWSSHSCILTILFISWSSTEWWQMLSLQGTILCLNLSLGRVRAVVSLGGEVIVQSLYTFNFIHWSQFDCFVHCNAWKSQCIFSPENALVRIWVFLATHWSLTNGQRGLTISPQSPFPGVLRVTWGFPTSPSGKTRYDIFLVASIMLRQWWQR